MILRSGVARPIVDQGDFNISFEISSGSVTISFKTKEMTAFQDIPSAVHTSTTSEIYSLPTCDVMATLTGTANVVLERVE